MQKKKGFLKSTNGGHGACAGEMVEMT